MFDNKNNSFKNQGGEKKIANEANEDYENLFKKIPQTKEGDKKSDSNNNLDLNQNQEKNNLQENNSLSSGGLKIKDSDIHHMPDKFLKPEKPPQKKKNIVIILAIVVVILVILVVAAFAFFVLNRKDPQEEKEILNLENEEEIIEEDDNSISEYDLETKEGRDNKRINDILEIRSALSFYYDDVDKYPYSLDSLKNYINEIPINPEPGGEEYFYEVRNDGQDYILTFVLEDGGDLGNLSLKSGKYQLEPNLGISSFSKPEPEPDEPEPEPEPDEPEPDPGLLPIPDKGDDNDNDGLTDVEELLFGTKFALPDSDFDGYNDGEEIFSLYNPLNDGGKLSNSDLVSIYNNEIFNYSVLYPQKWTLEEGTASLKEIVFRSVENKDFFKIQTEDNPQNLDVERWYSYFSGNENVKMNIFNNDNVQGIKTKDGFNVYISHDNHIYILSYILVNTEELNYFRTFEMFVNSFNFFED